MFASSEAVALREYVLRASQYAPPVLRGRRAQGFAQTDLLTGLLEEHAEPDGSDDGGFLFPPLAVREYVAGLGVEMAYALSFAYTSLLILVPYGFIKVRVSFACSLIFEINY